MQEGADFARWNHTTAIQATLANTVRDPKKRKKPFSGREFHPHVIYAAEQRKKKEGKPKKNDKVSITILRDIFVDGTPWNDVEEKHGINLRE
jgi:hypothetical protein